MEAAGHDLGQADLPRLDKVIVHGGVAKGALIQTNPGLALERAATGRQAEASSTKQEKKRLSTAMASSCTKGMARWSFHHIAV